MNLSILNNNHAADLGIGCLTKSISKVYGRETAMPTAWEFNGKMKSETLRLSKCLSEVLIYQTKK